MLKIFENYKRKRLLKKEIEENLSILESIDENSAFSMNFNNYKHFFPKEINTKVSLIVKEYFSNKTEKLIQELENLK